MQINRVGYFSLALFGIGGLVFAMFGSTRLLGIIWVATSVGLGVFAINQRRRGRHERQLFEGGLRGRATVVEASSGGTFNDQPIVKLVLDLDVPGQGTRRVTDHLVMARFAARRMKPGVVLPAHVSPTDPEDFFVQW